jgi:hypothetical protein
MAPEIVPGGRSFARFPKKKGGPVRSADGDMQRLLPSFLSLSVSLPACVLPRTATAITAASDSETSRQI